MRFAAVMLLMAEAERIGRPPRSRHGSCHSRRLGAGRERGEFVADEVVAASNKRDGL